MDVEGIAIHAVEGALLDCPRIRSFIDRNDKTPITDGWVDLYSAVGMAKKNLLGRVTVQVKGQQIGKTRRLREFETYQVDRSDLQGFLNSNGAVFFLVFINKNEPSKRTIYHAILNPFKIQDLLGQMKDAQKTKAVQFKPFPLTPEGMISVLGFAIQAQNESVTLGFDSSLFDDVKELKVYSDSAVDLERPLVLKHEDLDYSVVLHTTSGMAIPVPGAMKITPQSYVGQNTSRRTSCGKFTYESGFVRRIDDDQFELQLGTGMKLTLPASNNISGKTGTAILKLSDSLGQRYRDIGFFLAFCESGEIKFDGVPARFDTHMHEPDVDLRDHFAFLERLVALFQELNADSDLIRMDEITPHLATQLESLYRAIVLGTPPAEVAPEPGRLVQPVGEWSLELVRLAEEATGSWTYHGLCSANFPGQIILSTQDEPHETNVSRVTPYDVIDEDRFPYVLNLNLENVVASYSEIFNYPEASVRANNMVLRLINAADRVEARRFEFLSAAANLNDWLISKEERLDHHQINKWQIKHRLTELTPEDFRDIRSLRRRTTGSLIDNDQQVAVFCSVLLGDWEEAEEQFAGLSVESLAHVKEWPIWRLFETKSETVKV